MPTLAQKITNEEYFNKIAKITKMWSWTDEMLCYTIENNKFVCDTQEKYLKLDKIVRKSFIKNHCVLSYQSYTFFPEEETDPSPQYKQKCDNDCGTILSISTAIMCWSKGEEEKTLCNECYWDGGFYKDDDNEDNEEEIKDYIVEKNCPCYGECCDEYHLEKDCSCIISTPVE